MDIVHRNHFSENEMVPINGSLKPLSSSNVNYTPAGKSRSKKGLSVISQNSVMGATPTQRRKLGNLSNTPLLMQKRKTAAGNESKCSSLKKPKESVQPEPESSSVQKKTTTTTTITSVTLPTINEEIENCYPYDNDQFFDENFPSEIGDWFVRTYHPIILQAPIDDDDVLKAEELLRQQQEAAEDDDYFEGLL